MANTPRKQSQGVSKKSTIAKWNAWPETMKNKNQAVGYGNIGDSIESRLNNMWLGGGSDSFQNMFGLNAYWGAQGDGIQSGGGLANDPRFAGVGGNGPNSNSTKAAWLRIKLCREVYENDGQVASLVDLMADFASDGLLLNHKSKSVENFFRAWAEQVNLKERMRRAVIDMLLAGTTFFYKVYAKLKEEDINALKNYSSGLRVENDLIVFSKDDKEYLIEPKIALGTGVKLLFNAFSDENKTASDKSIEEEIKKLVKAKLVDAHKNKKSIAFVDEAIKAEKNKIPWQYISLNGTQMYPNEDGGWSYLLTKQDLKALIGKLDISFDELNNSIKVQLPDGISGTIKPLDAKEVKGGFFAEMVIDSSKLVCIPYTKFDWSRWAIPMLWKVMPTIMFKNTLKAMEFKAAKSAINIVTLWKLGDHKEGLIPEAEHFERLADMLKAPSQTINVLWDSAIEAEVIQPDLNQIFDPARWEGIRKEVTSQFGITQAIATGEGGNFSSSYISVQGLLERLGAIREIMTQIWLIPDLKQITKAMGFRNLPTITFSNMSLRDEKAEKQLLLNLADRGYLSDETLFEYLGKDIDTERRRLLDQEAFDKANKLERRGPFYVPSGSEELAKLKVSMKPKKPGVNGRPPGSKGPQKNTRTSKPRNLSSVDLTNIINKYDAFAKESLIAIHGKKLYKELDKVSKDKVIDLVCYHLAESIWDDSQEKTLEVFKASANSELEFTDDKVEFVASLTNKVSAFIKENNKKPTKEDVYNIFKDVCLDLIEKYNH